LASSEGLSCYTTGNNLGILVELLILDVTVKLFADTTYIIGFIGQRLLHDSALLEWCLSVTRMLCDQTKEHTANILIPDVRVIILLCDTKSGWWAMSSST